MVRNQESSVSPLLAVAWQLGRNVHGRKLNTGGELDEYLRSIVEETDATLADARIEPYRTDGGEPEAETVYLTARSDRIDTALIDELSRGEDLDFANLAELRTRRLACYAIVDGVGEQRRLYVRRQDPVKLASKRLFTFLMAGSLDRLDAPVLAFDDFVDVVIEEDRIFVLNPKGFESLFRGSELVLEAVPKWVDELRGHVPFGDGSRDVLLANVRRNGIHRRKLLAILDSPYVSTLTPKRIRKRMKQHGLEHERLLPEDTLQLNEQDIEAVLRLLNEELYRGDFSNRPLAANGKRLFKP